MESHRGTYCPQQFIYYTQEIFRIQGVTVWTSCCCHTPASTPRSTPVQSPVRAGKDNRSGKVMEPTKKKGKRDDDPGVVLLTYRGSNVPEKKMAHLAKLNFIQKSGTLKYVYQNKMYSSQKVKEFITQRKVDLGNAVMYRVDRDQFDKVIMGQYMELQLEK